MQQVFKNVHFIFVFKLAPYWSLICFKIAVNIFKMQSKMFASGVELSARWNYSRGDDADDDIIQ